MPKFSTGAALSLLWGKAVNNLNEHELEWFAACAAGQLQADANNLSETLEGIGLIISNGDDVEDEQLTSQGGISKLMFNISSQLSAIAGLSDIAADASSRLPMNGGAA